MATGAPAGLYSRPMGPNPMLGSEPLDRAAMVGARTAGSGLPHFGYSPPAGLVMHDSEGNPILDRPALSGTASPPTAAAALPGYPGRTNRRGPAVPSMPSFPGPTFTYDLFPA